MDTLMESIVSQKRLNETGIIPEIFEPEENQERRSRDRETILIHYLKSRIKKRKIKRTFQEYGYEIKKFHLSKVGTVEYAQWLHPLEQPKDITKSGIDFYKTLLRSGDLSIDIGAHTGDTTVPMAIAAGAKGLVLAFEPNPYVFKVLEQNSKLNVERTNIHPLCLAATKKDGEFLFNYSDASFCNGGFLSEIKNKRHGHRYRLKVKGGNIERYIRKQ